MVTIKDIARRLKISASTVSRALRGSADIREETREMVRQLATELNYSPNPIALSLKEKKSKIIGVVVPEIANYFCSSTIAGIEDVAYSQGYHVVIFQSHEQYEREVINTQLITSRRVDGLIIALSNETEKIDHLTEVNRLGIPIVMFDRVHEAVPAHRVVVNDYEAAFDATEHLITEGFRDIAHITISGFLSITRNRLAGYRDALLKHGIPVRKEWIVHCNFNPGEMQHDIRALFEKKRRPNAIMASVERVTMASVGMLQDMGLRIPDDVAIIGFSDNPLSRLIAPSLSCIRQPTFDIGQRSAELLLDLIEKKNKKDTLKTYKTIRLNTTMDIHASSTHSSRRSSEPAAAPAPVRK